MLVRTAKAVVHLARSIISLLVQLMTWTAAALFPARSINGLVNACASGADPVLPRLSGKTLKVLLPEGVDGIWLRLLRTSTAIREDGARGTAFPNGVDGMNESRSFKRQRRRQELLYPERIRYFHGYRRRQCLRRCSSNGVDGINRFRCHC